MKGDVDVMVNIEDGKLKFYLNQLKHLESSGLYSPCRSTTKRCRLLAGVYVIIPSTHSSDEATKFLLRIFSEKELDPTMKACVSCIL